MSTTKHFDETELVLIQDTSNGIIVYLFSTTAREGVFFDPVLGHVKRAVIAVLNT